VHAVDIVLHEVIRNQTPTSEAIATFVKEQALTVVTTEVWLPLPAMVGHRARRV
jgi:hypothetical protein